MRTFLAAFAAHFGIPAGDPSLPAYLLQFVGYGAAVALAFLALGWFLRGPFRDDV